MSRPAFVGCRVEIIVFCLLYSSLGFALDREAFTFTNYDLNVRVEPEQQRLAVRGKIKLRNDSSAPQKNLSLQISSSLNWRAIQADGKPVQFVSQPYASDIDHTGSLSEAIVTLPRCSFPKIDGRTGYRLRGRDSAGRHPVDADRTSQRRSAVIATGIRSASHSRRCEGSVTLCGTRWRPSRRVFLTEIASSKPWAGGRPGISKAPWR